LKDAFSFEIKEFACRALRDRTWAKLDIVRTRRSKPSPMSFKMLGSTTHGQGLLSYGAGEGQLRERGLSFPRLYAIIDPAQAGGRSPLAVAEIFLAAGVRLLQFRDKRASSGEVFVHGREIAERVRQSKGIFIINDRADVARAVDADGVHVGQEDLPVELARRILAPGKWVGCSTHRLEQVIEADRSSADYIAFGPIFPTKSKEKPDPVVGLEALREARRATRKPLVAIGGISIRNAREVIEAGADAVAVVRDLLQAPEIGRHAEEFLKVLGET
jgi:thiamine-phosphate diphosphorylase